jgi:hypothetical protein
MAEQGVVLRDSWIVAMRAAFVLEDISARRQTRERIWQPSDTRAVSSVILLEQIAELPLALNLTEIPAEHDQRKTYRRAWHTYHTALPFSEAERGLLTTHWFGVFEDEFESEVISAGVHQSILGRELHSRWLNWRTESGVYEKQGVLAIARKALSEIVQLADPERELPAAYLARRQ